MDPAEFNDLYRQNLFDTLAFENKDKFLMGHFNIFYNMITTRTLKNSWIK